MPIVNRGPCACCNPLTVKIQSSSLAAAPGVSQYNLMNGLPSSIDFEVIYGGTSYYTTWTQVNAPAIIASQTGNPPAYPATITPFPQYSSLVHTMQITVSGQARTVQITLSASLAVWVRDEPRTYTMPGNPNPYTWTQGIYEVDIDTYGTPTQGSLTAVFQ